MRKALIVGINNYDDKEIKNLTSCVNDANRVKSLLEKNFDGEKNFHCKLLISPTSVVLRSEIASILEIDVPNSDPDVVFIYFSGHGSISRTGGYILTTEARTAHDGISMLDIIELAGSRSKRIHQVVIVLDCCYAGNAGNISGVNIAQLGDGITIIAACRELQAAKENDQGSVFTSHFCDALEGKAADNNGNISAAYIYAYIDKALAPFEQRPVFRTNVSNFKSLRQCFPSRTIPELGIKNIFGIHKENYWRDRRMEELLSNNDVKEIILLARTGNSYLSDTGYNFKAGVESFLKKNVNFKVLLENPFSPDARLRWENIPDSEPWDKTSKKTISRRIREFKNNLEIKFTDYPTYCSLFFIKDSVIYDPYHLGRSDQDGPFGNEFIVIEFTRMCNPHYYNLLKNHFDFLWKNTKTLKQVLEEERNIHVTDERES